RWFDRAESVTGIEGAVAIIEIEARLHLLAAAFFLDLDARRAGFVVSRRERIVIDANLFYRLQVRQARPGQTADRNLQLTCQTSPPFARARASTAARHEAVF